MQCLLVALLVFGFLTVTAGAEVRTWKDSTGSYSVKAEFVGMSGKTVRLRREDGKITEVPLDRLSKADREHIRNLDTSSPKSLDTVAPFIHPDFCAAVVVHPKQLAGTPIGKSLRLPELLKILAESLEVDADALIRAWDPSKIQRITILVEPFPGGNVAFFPGVVIEFAEDVPGLRVVRTLWPNSKLSDSDPKLITGLDEMAGAEIQACVAGPRTLLIAPSTTMELMRSERQGASNVLKGKLSKDYDESEIVVTYVSRPVQERLQKLTGLTERELREDPETDDFVKTVVLDVSSASLKVQLKQSPSLALIIDCPRLDHASQFKEIISGGVSALVTAISTPDARNQLKQELKDEFPPPVLEFVDSPGLRELAEGIQVRQRGRSVSVSFEVPESAVAVLKKSVRDFTEANRPIADSGDWIVIFRSNDPAVWNSDVDEGTKHFAIPLSRVPAGIEFLRLKIDDERFAIIEMTKDNLSKQFENGEIGWVGTNLNQWNGRHLGIYNKRWTDAVRGTVHIWPLQNRGIRGWGFGNHVKLDDGQSYTWEGKTIGKTVFELSVKSGELTEAEKQALLR